MIKTDSTYHYYYPLNSSTPSEAGVHYATSIDGAAWNEHATNPLIAAVDFTYWTPSTLQGISVLSEAPTTLKMWFGGKYPVSGVGAIGLATSP